MRDLNEIVTRNAKRFIAEAQAAATREGRKLSTYAIGRRWGEAMGVSPDTARKQLERCLEGESDWRAVDIQGLSAALGKTPTELVSLDPDAERIPEATVAQALYTALNHRLTMRETRGVIRRLHRQLDHRPLFDLIQAVTDRILDAETKADAALAAMKAVEKSAAWDSKRADLRGQKSLDDSS